METFLVFIIVMYIFGTMLVTNAAQNHYLTNNYGMNYEKDYYGYAANPYLQQFECTGTDEIQ